LRPGNRRGAQRARLDFVERLDRRFADSLGHEDQVEAAIQNFETAFRMQAAVPEVCEIEGESEATRRLYGLDDPDPEKAAFARQALLARRLVERGVRFVELSCLTKGIGAGGAANPWDQHGELEKGHRAMAYQVDQPIAALLEDLKSRGLLDETIVVFTGEFGRTPFSQGSNGGITIPTDTACGWRGAASAVGRSMEPPMSSATTSSTRKSPSTTSGPPSCTS